MSPAPERLTVVVGDDDARIRAAVVALLEDEHFTVVGQADDGDGTHRQVQDLGAALVLVDVRMPGGGAALVRRLARLPHRPVVVALSAQADAASWTGVLTAGANGYLLKGAVGDDLGVLLRRCLDGELVVAVPGAAAVVRRLLSR